MCTVRGSVSLLYIPLIMLVFCPPLPCLPISVEMKSSEAKTEGAFGLHLLTTWLFGTLDIYIGVFHLVYEFSLSFSS